MIRDFHFTEAQAIDELPLARAFAYRAFATETNPWAAVDRVTDGYIAQQAYRSLHP